MRHIVEQLRAERPEATIRDGGGPVRVIVDQPDPEFVRRPVGFTAAIEQPVVEPKLWGGDQA